MRTPRPSPHPRNERGIALVTAVLFVMLTAAVAGTFIATTVHERAASSSVGIAKASLYSAEGGVRTVQQQLANVAKLKLDSLITVYKAAGSTGALIKQPTKTFPAGTQTYTSTNPKFTAVYSIDYSDSLLGDVSQEFNYRYRVVSTGQYSAQGKRTIESTGQIKLSAGKGTFADYLMFTDIHSSASGGAVWFTTNTKFDGRIHTNGKFRFASKPTFGDLATSQGSTAYFYNSGKTKELNASSNAPTDIPVFSGGFSRNVTNIPLPTNTFYQETAALGQTPSTTYDPTNAEINTACGTAPGSSPPPSGVYLPVIPSSSILKGGIYVQGNLTSARLSIDGSGNQVYTLKQSSTTWVVTVNRTTNTTSYKKGSNPTINYTGVPNGSLYCVGSISDFGGPTRTTSTVAIPGVANNTQLLVTASSDIVVQSDILSNDFTNGKSVVGLYSHGGSVRIGSNTPNDVQLDAFLMALGTSSVVTVDNYDDGSPRGEVVLRGGLISKYYGAFGTFGSDGKTSKTGYRRNFKYDGRGISPPFFPTTPTMVANIPSARTLAWKER